MGAVTAFALRSLQGLIVSAGVAFFAIASLLAVDASSRAVQPPLRTLYDEHVSPTDSHPVIVEGHLRRDAMPTDYGASLSIAVEQAVIDGLTYDTAGGIRVGVGGGLVPGRIDAWRAGRAVRLPVLLRRPAPYLNPGVPDQERRSALRGTALRGSVKSAALVDVLARGHWLSEAAAEARATVRGVIARTVGTFSARSGGIVTAILIGDRAGLDDETARRLQEAGTYHVIAISGGNIAILAGLLLLIFKVGGVAPRLAAGTTIVALVAYACLVGDEASVVRATFVAVVYLGARAVDHRTPPLNGLGLAAFVILCAKPLAIFAAGFALTFGATLAILIGVPGLTSAGRRIIAAFSGHDPTWIRPLLALPAATICAEAALMPISAYMFSRVSFAGIALNFLAIPLMTIAQVSGLATVVLAAVHDGASLIAGYLAHLAATGLVESTRFLDAAPWLVVRVPAPAVPVVLAYYGGWMGWLWLRRPLAVRRVAMAVVLAAAVWMLVTPVEIGGSGSCSADWRAARAEADEASEAMGCLSVTFLDVGQADAALVRFPTRHSLLVDTGGSLGGAFDVGSRIVAPALWTLGVRRLDYLALTHGDPDHIGGAAAVLRDFRPREVWEGVPVPGHRPMSALEAQALAQGAVWRMLQLGDNLRVGEARVQVLHPPPPDWERQKVRNDDSLVLELRLGEVSILLTGDIGQEVEPQSGSLLSSARLRVVKVPHHGSRNSSSAGFIAATRPAIAVVSVGRANRFGHPAPMVVERYRKAGAAVFRTDRHGAISAETDGRMVRVSTQTGQKLFLDAH